MGCNQSKAASGAVVNVTSNKDAPSKLASPPLHANSSVEDELTHTRTVSFDDHDLSAACSSDKPQLQAPVETTAEPSCMEGASNMCSLAAPIASVPEGEVFCLGVVKVGEEQVTHETLLSKGTNKRQRRRSHSTGVADMLDILRVEEPEQAVLKHAGVELVLQSSMSNEVDVDELEEASLANSEVESGTTNASGNLLGQIEATTAKKEEEQKKEKEIAESTTNGETPTESIGSDLDTPMDIDVEQEALMMRPSEEQKSVESAGVEVDEKIAEEDEPGASDVLALVEATAGESAEAGESTPMNGGLKSFKVCAGCDVTETQPGMFKYCAKCQIVSYCGRDCQVKHWKQHKKVCCSEAIDMSSSRLMEMWGISPAKASPFSSDSSELLMDSPSSSIHEDAVKELEAVLRRLRSEDPDFHDDEERTIEESNMTLKRIGSSLTETDPVEEARRIVEAVSANDDSDENTPIVLPPVRTCVGCETVEKTPGMFRECAKCRCVLYCNRKCQKSHWKMHKKTCCKTDSKKSVLGSKDVTLNPVLISTQG